MAYRRRQLSIRQLKKVILAKEESQNFSDIFCSRNGSFQLFELEDVAWGMGPVLPPLSAGSASSR